MDSENPSEAEKVWRWNINGLGYSSTGIGGPFLAIYSWYKRKIEDRIDKLEARVEKLEKSNVTQFEELTILLKGQLACLQGLKEQGYNGPVTQAIDDINDYLQTKINS